MDRAQAKAELFLALLRPLQRPLEVYCRRMLRDRSLVEDVLQSAVMEAFTRFDRYAEGTNFRAWMFRFVTLEIFNRNRKHEPVRFRDLPSDTLPEPPAPSSDREDTIALLLRAPEQLLEHFEDGVAEALRQLPANERAVLLLRAIGELSYHDIHELLSIPMGSVIGCLSRARQKLRRSLAGYAPRRGIPSRVEEGEPQP